MSPIHNMYFAHHSYMFRLPQRNHNKAVHRTVKRNTHDKTNKCTNIKRYFLHTSCHNSDMFRSILIIFNELLNISKAYKKYIFLLWRCDPTRVMASSFLRFLDYTQRRTTVGRTPLDEWSARRRDFYLTTHNTHNRQTSMPPVRFESKISAGDRPQTYALDRAATGTGAHFNSSYVNFSLTPNVSVN
jgi:hypothetical protein